jgi:hypothetical protein
MKLKFLSITLAMVMLFTFVSCGEKEKSVNGSGTNEVTTSDVNSGVVSENGSGSENTHTAGTFDFNEVVQNIYLFDKKISLPCTVSEMGEEYTLSENFFEMPDTTHVFYNLYYLGDEIGSVTISEEDSDDEYNSEIKSIHLEEFDENEKKFNIDILGISFQSTKTDIENIFGKPDKLSDTKIVYYSEDKNSYIYFYIQEKSEKFNSISIVLSKI